MDLFPKKSVKYVSKCKQPCSQAALEIHYSTHTCIYLLGFSKILESELKKFICFHCPKLVADQQFKKENTSARRECWDVHGAFSEFCREEQRPHLCSTSPLWMRCVDSSRHLDQPKVRVGVCSMASKELVA